MLGRDCVSGWPLTVVPAHWVHLNRCTSSPATVTAPSCCASIALLLTCLLSCAPPYQQVHIEPGHRHGSKVVFRGEAGSDSPDVLPGDLIFILEQVGADRLAAVFCGRRVRRQGGLRLARRAAQRFDLHPGAGGRWLVVR